MSQQRCIPSSSEYQSNFTYPSGAATKLELDQVYPGTKLCFKLYHFIDI
jgi:hypothetical protein